MTTNWKSPINSASRKQRAPSSSATPGALPGESAAMAGFPTIMCCAAWPKTSGPSSKKSGSTPPPSPNKYYCFDLLDIFIIDDHYEFICGKV